MNERRAMWRIPVGSGPHTHRQRPMRVRETLRRYALARRGTSSHPARAALTMVLPWAPTSGCLSPYMRLTA